MVETSHGLRPPDDPADFLRIAPELNEFVDVDLIPLLNKDSTNMHPEDWTGIATTIYERRHRGYDGFVIAHGTDTMHFTSSALAFAFGTGLNFPIVLTGAQTIPEVRHGDARINLIRACKVALSDLAEVVVSFGDYVFRGCRVQKKDERRFDAFESPGFFPVGYIEEAIELHPNAKVHDPAVGLDAINFRPEFESGILQVALIPGLEPDLIVPSIENALCKGLMLQSFGWGNVPDEARFSFREVIEHCVYGLGKPVVIVSQFPAHSTLGSAYTPGIEAVGAGAIPTGNMTNAAAVAKFRWILAQVDREVRDGNLSDRRLDEIRARMQQVYVGEMD